MTRTTAGLVALGVAAGFFGGTILHRIMGEDSGSASHASVMGGSAGEVSPWPADASRKIAELQNELEDLRRNAALAADEQRGLPPPLNPAELAAEFARQAEQRKVDSLLAAGFTKERMDWLRRRTEELTAKRAQSELERRENGLPVDPNSFKYLFDPDLDLRKEIGDDEYARYREATGRSSGVDVSKVLAGSSAEGAGLRPGDQILSYGGRRVFSRIELNELAAKGKAGASVVVDVRRNGQAMSVLMPAGPVSIESRSGLPLPLSLPGRR